MKPKYSLNETIWYSDYSGLRQGIINGIHIYKDAIQYSGTFEGEKNEKYLYSFREGKLKNMIDMIELREKVIKRAIEEKEQLEKELEEEIRPFTEIKEREEVK